MSFSTHVVDAARGCPARGVPVTVCRRGDGSWPVLAVGVTDDDGRFRIPEETDALTTGPHRVDFDTGDYFSRTSQIGFYPVVSVTFEVMDASQHHHVPLLLSPFAYSTYRGS